jgi:hypothetical protein
VYLESLVRTTVIYTVRGAALKPQDLCITPQREEQLMTCVIYLEIMNFRFQNEEQRRL